MADRIERPVPTVIGTTMKTRSVISALALPLVALLTLAGCASSPSSAAERSPARISVVASTNVYGNIAETIGGNAIAVTSIESNPAQDPHSFQASAQNQLQLSKANIVIENGGGYDDFIGSMLKTANNPTAKIINVVQLSGKKPDANGDLNEHVWYDFPTVRLLTTTLVSALSKADPAHSKEFHANGAAFSAQLTSLEAREAALKTKYAGTGVSITEPVPVYMLNAIGLTDKTPVAFSHAIEEGNDVAPAVLEQTLALYSSKAVKVLVYNEQTTGPETQAVLNAAHKADIAVVPVTETLPLGTSYIHWMSDNLSAISTALTR